jgi:glycosyltransferase involved in cell wall biosynthesis
LVLRAFENRYPNLKITAVEKTELHWAGKKFALSIGIKAASHDYVLLTDADCVPSSNQWLKEMAQCFSPKHKVILGFGAYEKQPGMLNGIIRGETLLIGQQYLGLALCGFPYMGVGRNLAYHSDLFFDNRGFASHQFMPSGDDDLFINEVANAKNIQVCFNENSFTLSKPENRWKDYAEQKRRHLTTGSKYNLRSKLILSWLMLVRYSFMLFLLLGFLFLPPVWSGAIWLGNTTLLLALYYPTAKTIKARDLLPFLGFIEIFLHLFYPFLFIWNTFVSGSPWKNY